MNLGKWIAFAWDLLVWFLLISFLVLPVVFAYWRAREKADQKATEEALRSCKADTSGDHIYDGI